MKRFIIKPPRGGAQRATLVTHQYDLMTQRTRTVYLGSVDIRLNPDRLRSGLADEEVHIKPAAVACATPFVVDAGVRTEIADWLELHGTFAQTELAAQREKERRLEAELAARREVEAVVRSSIEADVRAELAAEMEQHRLHPVDAAVAAVKAAGEALIAEALQLRELGSRLTSIRAQGVNAVGGTQLDALQAAANRLRLQEFAAFESACKKAGLMKSRRPRQGAH
ncbi:hypothetical protein [Roseateles sp. BYS96W]|uniref:Uncharacterized protein n=1 Tax=Pelomonas nitida TaxID=3299027 RepID=A0ABW7G8V6_9BURK